MFILEAGINHFGNLSETKILTKFFLNSSFRNISFMIHSKNFYLKESKSNLNFELPYNFYKSLIDKCHKKNKRIGVSVCDLSTYSEFRDLNFDFYKLLSISINDFDLIKELRKVKKKIYISTGFGSSNSKIKKCIKNFGSKAKLEVLHTPMSYDSSNLSLNKIENLKKKYNLPIGYSHHNNNQNTIYALSAYKPSTIFVYCKQLRKKNRVYPDNEHAFFIDELEKLKKDYNECLKMHSLKKKFSKINIFKNKIKF